jgi:hypothetical protein
MKDAYYFKHDCNARHDPKIQALINCYGIEGYGRFWILIEILRESKAYKLDDKPYNWDYLAEQFKCSNDNVKKFISDCVNKFDLLINENGYFYSPTLLKRMIKLDEIRLKRQSAASESWRDR